MLLFGRVVLKANGDVMYYKEDKKKLAGTLHLEGPCVREAGERNPGNSREYRGHLCCILPRIPAMIVRTGSGDWCLEFNDRARKKGAVVMSAESPQVGRPTDLLPCLQCH